MTENMAHKQGIMCVLDAKIFSIAAHESIGQKRKYNGEPYWCHCERVVELLQYYYPKYDYSMVAAAWLHDVLEDTSVTSDVLRIFFNKDIVKLVQELTNESKAHPNKNRRERKYIDKKKLEKVSKRAKIIKMFDIFDNVKDIIENDPNFAKTYIKENETLIEVLKDGDEYIYNIVRDFLLNQKTGLTK